MSKELDALEKIDHTVCLNLNNKTLKFALDEYDNCDCKNFEEFDECYAVIEKSLKALEIIKPYVCDYLRYDKITDDYLFLNYPISKKTYDLLKEVLL